MQKEILLTKAGLEKIKEELKKLKDVDRKEVISRIKIAKEFGDLSENSEYEDAKNEQAFIEGRIQELESMIKNARLILNDTKGKVGLGSTVVVDIEGEKDTYNIVGPTETDPVSGRISSESPVGRALIGKAKGEVVEVATPDGKASYKIVEVK